MPRLGSLLLLEEPVELAPRLAGGGLGHDDDHGVAQGHLDHRDVTRGVLIDRSGADGCRAVDERGRRGRCARGDGEGGHHRADDGDDDADDAVAS